MLEIGNLTVGYGEKAILENLNFSFKPNKIYGLIGRNGAGKTTLLQTIARLQDELAGMVKMNGESLKDVDYFDIDVTFISGDHSFFQDLTMYEQMVFLCKINGMSKSEAIEKISHAFRRFKLEEYSNYYPHALSRGTLQRFGLVSGFLRNSNVFLLDEPFVTLDPVQVKVVENVLLEYKNECRIMIISSHDLDSLEAICDEYIIIQGKQLLSFKPDEIHLNDVAKIIGDSYE